MAVRSKTTIFNAALVRTGHSEDQNGSALWEALDANYDEIVRGAFEDGDGVYPFGKARVSLTSRTSGTLGYEDAYALPSDVIHIIEVYLNGYAAADLLEDWEIDGVNNRLEVDAKQRPVEIEYVKEGLEYRWSARFALGVQRRLEAVIKDVLEETEEAAMKEQEADLQFMKGSVKASKNRSQRRVAKKYGGRLTRARRGQR